MFCNILMYLTYSVQCDITLIKEISRKCIKKLKKEKKPAYVINQRKIYTFLIRIMKITLLLSISLIRL